MAQLETTVIASSEVYARNHAAQSARVETLRERIAAASGGGRLEMVERHRNRGKLLALFDHRIGLNRQYFSTDRTFHEIADLRDYFGKVPA